MFPHTVVTESPLHPFKRIMKLTPLISLLFPNFTREPHLYKSLEEPSLKFRPDGSRVLLFPP